MPRVFCRVTACCLRSASCPEESIVRCRRVIYCTIRYHHRLVSQGRISVQSQLCSIMVKRATVLDPSLKVVLFLILALFPVRTLSHELGRFPPSYGAPKSHTCDSLKSYQNNRCPLPASRTTKDPCKVQQHRNRIACAATRA